MRYPDYVTFRHADNQKWFALIMNITRDKLGLPGHEAVDILNVKAADLLLADLLVQQDGYFRGYPISRGNWISILLDGSVPLPDVVRWVDESYLATASKAERLKHRPPKEWIVPANPKYFDIAHAFDSTDEIHWKQGAGIRKADTVFMYVAAPVSAILYRCKVTDTDIPCKPFQDGELEIRSLMKIKLLRRYEPERFPFESLSRDYGIHAVRSPRGIPYSLSEALKRR